MHSHDQWVCKWNLVLGKVGDPERDQAATAQFVLFPTFQPERENSTDERIIANDPLTASHGQNPEP